jgi:hypothetical protein
MADRSENRPAGEGVDAMAKRRQGCGVLVASVIAAMAAGSVGAAEIKPTSSASAPDALAQGARYPMFASELKRVRKEVDAAMKAGIDVPVPKDPGGGRTHEQHKRNYTAIYGAGLLYRATGDKAYADYAGKMLLAYAKLYPGLGPHPAASNEAAGRLFWQSLNDAVWLVYSIQGYDAVREALSPQDRQTIEQNVFRPMAKFLSDDQPHVFDIIHNHATWACAAVGMTGYVLNDQAMVNKALKGLDGSGKTGFLRQIDELFSPDGYYTEGPYYQRYALQPFVVFAHAIDANEPGRKIFAYRDGVLLKAIQASVQLTYDGYFFPFNDAMPDKSLQTDELYQAVAIGYGVTRDPSLLSIAKWQGRTTLTAEGLEVARDVAADKAQPFPYASMLLRDGPNGEQGGLAIMRSDPSDRAEVLVVKNTAQGMGHGHYDKLNWILYDNGHPIVTDYGAARFLNIEAKDGGRYLAENNSWAKQTVAHNTLVVNEISHFGGKVKAASALAPRQIFFADAGATKISTAEMVGAYPGVAFRRTLAQVVVEGLTAPLVVDLLTVKGDKPAQYDLPLHFAGQIIDAGFPLQSNVGTRPVLGPAAGYQHLWVDATGTPDATNARLTWINDNRFYTWRMLPPAGASVILAESGANDPKFNLRREPVLIERVKGATDTTFVGVLEPHGAYDPSAETTKGSTSRIRALRHIRVADADVVSIELVDGRTVTLAVADDADAGREHKATIGGKAVTWKGHFGRFDSAGGK